MSEILGHVIHFVTSSYFLVLTYYIYIATPPPRREPHCHTAHTMDATLSIMPVVGNDDGVIRPSTPNKRAPSVPQAGSSKDSSIETTSHNSSGNNGNNGQRNPKGEKGQNMAVLTKAITHPTNTFEVEASTRAQSEAPPNGGFLAWLQVAAGFVLYLNTWGIISSFSVFQTYYETDALFTATSAEISWIGAVQCFFLLSMGLVAGPLFDRGHLRWLLLFGSILVVGGHLTLSLCTTYWQTMLTQGVCVGIGTGLLFNPTVSLIPRWFTSHMGLALGVAATGSSVGGVIYPLLFAQLLPHVGFGWTVRVIGFVIMAAFLFPIIAMRVRVPTPRPRAIIDRTAFTDVPYMLFTLAIFTTFIGQTVLIFYISYYPMDTRITTPSLALHMAAIFNAGSFLGRLVPNWLSDHIGPLNTQTPFTFFLAVSVLCLIPVKNTYGMVIEAVVTGFFSGAVVAMSPVCIRLLTDDPSRLGTRNGMAFAIGAFGLIVGGPAGGTILESSKSHNGWITLWLFAAHFMLLGALLCFVARTMIVGYKIRTRI